MRGVKLWLGLTALAILSAIVVPYGLLAGRAAGFDIVIFWCGFGVIVIALIWAGVSRWRLP